MNEMEEIERLVKRAAEVRLEVEASTRILRRMTTLMGASRTDSTHYPLIKVMSRLGLIRSWLL